MGEKPLYIEVYEKGELEKRVKKAKQFMKKCFLCPLACGANREEGEKGNCGVGKYAILSSFGPHFGEEPPLVGSRGSGTVFFSGCSLRCIFCQNYEISQLRRGEEVSPNELADIFLAIQRMGCHNLNLVTPSHVIPQWLEALLLAVEKGFSLPIVYNSSGYDSIIALKILDGVVDIYMPDFKYGDSENALRYSNAKGYFEVAKKSIKEMHRQVGDLQIENGIARRGLLIRHLILPNGLAGSKKVLDFIRNSISQRSYVNLMEQYYPTYNAFQVEELSRRITKEEYWDVVRYAMKIGINRGIPMDMLEREKF